MSEPKPEDVIIAAPAAAELRVDIIDPADVHMKDTLPIDLKGLYDILYKEFEEIADGGKFDIRDDPTTIRLFIEGAMMVVEKFHNADDIGWSGADKKRHALTLIKVVIADLATAGKIDKKIADSIIDEVDFWGGIAMDIAVDAAKKTFDIGQIAVKEMKKKGCCLVV